MFQLDTSSLGLGIALAAVGVMFWVASRIIMRTVPRLRPVAQPLNPISVKGLDKQEKAVLVIQPGGLVVSINDQGRQLFHLGQDEIPDLERLAKRLRPADLFLTLCAAEGRGQLILEGKPVEGVSYFLPVQPVPLVVLSLAAPQESIDLARASEGLSSKALQTFNDMTQTMGASLDLDATLMAVLENTERLLPSDFMQVTLWNKDEDCLIPYRFIGRLDIDRKLEVAAERYHAGECYSGYLAKNRTPLDVSNIEARTDLQPPVDIRVIPLRSYYGVPLTRDEEFIGTLELASLTREAFSPADQDLIRLLARPATIAIHNALLYQAEKRRSAELTGLTQLAQAFGSSQDIDTLYTKLVQSITPVIKVEILGFLIYNENQHILEGQVPFFGLPPQFIELYKVAVHPNSLAEQTLLNRDVIISENAAEDPQWVLLGLDHLAQAASLRDTVLVPLTATGRMIGYLQASNHSDGTSNFTRDELHLLMIIANQAAPIIENITLVQQTRQRAQRAEALRRIASLTTSAATLDEILMYSINELSHLLQSDLAIVFLLDQARGILQIHKPSLISDQSAIPERSSSIMVEDPQFPFTITGRMHALITDNLITEQAVIPFYQTLMGQWNVTSAVAVPLIIRDQGIGEIWFGSKNANFFSHGDLQLVSTAAGQLAGVVEQSYLVAQTDESLRRRVEQMTALTRISRELSGSLDINHLLRMVYDEALRTTRSDCGSIVLFDLSNPAGQEFKIRFFMGDEPSAKLTPLEQKVLESGELLSIPDTSQGEYELSHAQIESALIVPFLYLQQPLGLIVLHAKTANRYDATAIEIAQSLASQAAVVLGNALQYEEQMGRGELLKRQLETLGKLYQVSQVLRPNKPLEEALASISDAIREVTPFQAVVINIVDNEAGVLRSVYGAGISELAMEELQTNASSWRSIQALLQPEYQVGTAYFIPVEKGPDIPEDVHLLTVMDSSGERNPESWDPDDMLLVPLYDGYGIPQGLISLDNPRDGRRPDAATIEALDLFGQQAGLILESRRAINSLETRLSELEAERNRLHQSAESAQRHLPTLLHKELEQTISIQQLNQQIERVRAGLEIAEITSRQTEIHPLLHTLAREMLTRFNLTTALVAEVAGMGPRLVEVIGEVPESANPEALFGQRNPLRQILQDQHLILVSNLDNETEWKNSALLNALAAKSFIGLPLEIGDGSFAGVLCTGQKPLAPFSDQDRHIYTQLSRQVAVGLQNLQLLNETRRRLQEVNQLLEFSQKLGVLDPAAILRNLVDSLLKAISSGEAGWVALWSDKDKCLVPQAASGYPDSASLLNIRFKAGSKTHVKSSPPLPLPIRAFNQGHPQRVKEVNFAQDYSLPSGDLELYRQGTAGRLPVSSMLVPLRRGDNILGIVVLDNFDTPAAFTEEDEALTVSLSQQTALGLENAHLFMASEQRATQLQALTQIAGMVTSSLQSDQVTASLLDWLKAVIPYTTATLWLRQGDQLVVQSAKGFEDNESRVGLFANVEDSVLFKEMIQTGLPLSIADVRVDPRFPSLLEPENLSWLGIPLIVKSELIGVMALEGHEPDFYTPDHIQVAKTFASQAAIALENARLFEDSLGRAAELDQRSQRLALLNRLSVDLSASLDVDYILKLTAQQLLSALNGSRVAVVLTGENGQNSLHLEVPVGAEILPRVLPDNPLMVRLQESQGIFISSDIKNEPELVSLAETYFAQRGSNSLFVIPLVTGSNLLGWFWLQMDESYRFTVPEIELARTISNQAAIAVQNARQYAETTRLTEDLEHRVADRTAEFRREHQNTQTLLRIITELSTSLDMDQVLNRTLSVLNDELPAEQSMVILSQGSGRVYQAGLPLVGQTDGADKSKNRIEQEIARWVVRKRVPALVDDIRSDSRWTVADDVGISFKSVLAVPLAMGEDILGALLLFHSNEAFFLIEQVGVVEATARQIGIALSNSELFNLIRDQSERLGGMLREQQIEASRSRAILEAVADGVVVTDAKNCITLFNVSAERILDLKSSQVVGQSLEQFSGLFGHAARHWMQTIREWTKDPTVYKEGQTYAEQISLDNDRVVAIHLAPVIWRNAFLGTVSIFRDITHEVQVDRLKSEFVANVSHELRTPMTSIKGYVEIMLMGAAGELTPQQTHFMQIVRSNIQRLGVLVNDLLDISRIETGRVTLSIQSLDLQEIAEDVISDIQRRSQEENKPMEFSIEAAEELPRVKADQERIRQVLGSLVNNGYAYTPENGRVIIKMHSLDDEVQVDVQDNGVGILIKDQPRIFERFYRGEDPLVLASSGNGLGLAISKTIVEMHQGRIWFYSKGIRGEGSTFSFTIPVYRPEE